MGFEIDSHNSIKNNRSLLRDRFKFKSREKYFISLEKDKKDFKVSKGRNRHYKSYKKAYRKFVLRLFFVFLSLLILLIALKQLFEL